MNTESLVIVPNLSVFDTHRRHCRVILIPWVHGHEKVWKDMSQYPQVILTRLCALVNVEVLQ